MPNARQARTVTKDAAKADAEALIDALVAGEPAGALAFAERLAAERAHAQRHGHFKMWSIGNRIYLEGQIRKRDADVKHLFAGIKQWEAMGREVLEPEREKPFKIQGSPFYFVKGDQVDPDTNEPERVQRVGRAPIIDVYDWTQTRSTVDDYVEPDWEAPLGAGDYATLRQLAAAAGIPVIFDDLGGHNSHGRYDGTTITVDATIPVGNQIVELARQVAHHQLGHSPASSRVARTAAVDDDGTVVFTPRAAENAEATLVGWLVAKSLGLDEDTDGAVTTQAAEYLHRWTKFDADDNEVHLEGRKSRRKLLRDRLGVALKATDAILAAYVIAGVEEQVAV